MLLSQPQQLSFTRKWQSHILQYFSDIQESSVVSNFLTEAKDTNTTNANTLAAEQLLDRKLPIKYA